LSGRSWGLGRQSLPMREVVLCPLRLWQRPIGSGSPLVRSHEPVAHRRLIHDASVLSLQPVIVPPDDLVVMLVEWPFEVRRSGEDQLFRRVDVLEIVLRTEPMKLVGVRIGS